MAERRRVAAGVMWLLALSLVVVIGASEPAANRTERTLDARDPTPSSRDLSDDTFIAHPNSWLNKVPAHTMENPQVNRTKPALDYRDSRLSIGSQFNASAKTHADNNIKMSTQSVQKSSQPNRIISKLDNQTLEHLNTSAIENMSAATKELVEHVVKESANLNWTVLDHRDARPSSREPKTTTVSVTSEDESHVQNLQKSPKSNRAEFTLDYRDAKASSIKFSTEGSITDSKTNQSYEQSVQTEPKFNRTEFSLDYRGPRPSSGGPSSSAAYAYMDGASRRESGVRRVEESPAYASSVVLASDILSLSGAVAGVRDPVCRAQGYRFLDGLLVNKRWALKMFDASAKSPQGLLFGSSYHLGNFDECVGIQEEAGPGEVAAHAHGRIAGKYCLATIEWPQSEDVKKRRSGRSGELRWAVCVPAACNSGAVGQFVLDVLAGTVGNTSRVFVDQHDCYTRKPLEVNSLDVAFLSLMCFFAVVILLSTAYDVCRDRKRARRRVLQDVVVSFSAAHNLRKLLSTKQPNGFGLDCIAGIKTLAMVFITAGHACLFIASGPVMDAEAWDRLLRQPLNSFMLNNTLLVDTFLMLSAFLFSRLLLLELDKRRGRLNIIPIYIFRYIRVTPAYLVVILFYMTWLPKTGEGPLWKDKIQLEQERCAANWWSNILYVNNYVHSDALCMFQSWYLSVDTQLFFLAPVFIYPMWRWHRAGPAALVAAILLSAAVPAVVTYESSLDPTLMVYAKEFKDISQNYFFKEAYIKTHMKMTPYFMGLLFGYILHRVQAKNYVFSRAFKVVAWLTSVALGTSVVFSISLFYQEWYQYSIVDAASYAALHKLAWGLANGWLILACATGSGGFLGKLLTWKFLVPLSRLTFCAYLVNGVVELYYVGTLRHPLHISFFNVLAIGVSHIILTFLLAVVLCLVFESPIHGIEKILLRSFARPSDNARVDLSAENSSSRSTSQPKLDA